MSRAEEAPEGAIERRLSAGADWLVREEPLLIQVRDQSVLTMRTPGHDEDLAIGFLLAEGVLADVADVTSIDSTPGNADALEPDTVRVGLAKAPAARVAGRLTRTHEIRSSCGICGLVSADELLDDTLPLLSGVPRIDRAEIPGLLAKFHAGQVLFRRTGACHAAAVCTAEGTILGFGEDVGRHNALDKAIGQAARGGHDLDHAICLLSGRAGFDLVLKCLRVRIGFVISVSAASALSFDLCASAGATLIGFARGDDFKVYCDSGRLA
ncbi:MAG: formate dehydrogenase accessory sulfurtransferase FdhD [Planctomycetes bacterium]|nr:formate dehydrogenase accessory sulfurtransferase FdhD [Planctomycetota bacterium]